jgi:hypothetical protein
MFDQFKFHVGIDLLLQIVLDKCFRREDWRRQVVG